MAKSQRPVVMDKLSSSVSIDTILCLTIFVFLQYYKVGHKEHEEHKITNIKKIKSPLKFLSIII